MALADEAYSTRPLRGIVSPARPAYAVNRLVSGVGRSEAQHALFLAALLNQTVTEDPADTNTFDQPPFARSFLGYGAVSARILKAAQHFCP